MSIDFKIRGRLGNAIFRYMASVIMHLITNKEYNVYNDMKLNIWNIHHNGIKITDNYFYELSQKLLKEEKINIEGETFIMYDFYQHDTIYKKYKNEIINYINNHPEHFIISDGFNSADRNYGIYKMSDIMNTPSTFNKQYKNVLHLRLEDFIINGLYIKKERIIDLLNKNIITDNLCIVCKKPTTEFENNYIKQIKDFLIIKNINIVTEHNDIITDYYIMKEAETLICSNSTLSWCAAFFSNKIKLCYFPDYKETINQTCKKPIDSTILY